MRKPILHVVAGHLLGLHIALSGSAGWDAPDVPTAGTVGVEVDPLAIGRVIRAVIVAGASGQTLLRAALYGNAVDVEIAVALPAERKRLPVRRPAMEIAGLPFRDLLRLAAGG